MKLKSTTRFVLQSRQGFTLPELTVATGIFLLMIAGIISSHIFGLKMYEIARVKLGASDKARKAISSLSDELRRAKKVEIGNVTSGSFTKIGLNASQQGNAIQIFNAGNTNEFIRYFCDTDKKLKRMTNNVVTVVADSITNNVVFTKEDATGTVQTNDTGKYVIGLTLQFSQLEFINTSVSSNALFDSYQLKTKITPRN